MTSMLERMSKAGKIKDSKLLSKSEIFAKKDDIPTDIPIINIALSGSIHKGISSGLTFLAGPSRHFKSLLGLLFVKAYLNKYPDAICLFYDAEYGITSEYITANGIDPDRVLHIPIVHLEELKFDIANRLEAITKEDKVIIFIDSIGNLASKKEADDAINENSAADMTRAKTLKGLFRIITPHLPKKDIPLIAINHVYQEMGLFPKTIMGGGSGPMLGANQVFFIGKAQEKDGTELVGYNFTLLADKSRFVKEKSKFKFTVTYDRGIEKYSGLMDIAIDAGIVVKPSNGFYQKVNLETGEPEGKKYRMKETFNKEFWDDILTSKEFENYVAKTYKLGYNSLMTEEEEETEQNETE